MAQASELIKKGATERPKNGKDIESKIREDIENNLVPKIWKHLDDCFGNESVVEDEFGDNKKRYRFFGNGCGFAFFRYDKRSKRLGEWLGKFMDIYNNEYVDKISSQAIRKYGDKNMGAVVYQDMDLNGLVKKEAIRSAARNGINTDSVRIETRMD